MRYVSFGPKGIEGPGILLGDLILDIRLALARRGHYAIGTLTDLLSLPCWRDITDVLVKAADPTDMVAASAVRIGPPVPRPGKVIIMGSNFVSHVKEAAAITGGVPPRFPMAVGKAPTSVTGPTDDVVQPAGARTVDYEVELGVIIGAAVRGVPVERALEAVAGVTVVNDMAERDLQFAVHEDSGFYRSHYLGKSYDGFCPAGPALVTTDEIDDLHDPAAVQLRTWVNDDLRQDSSLTDLVFDIPQIVSYLSTVVTLLPGDLICTGSPAGVGASQTPPTYLMPGDLVRTEITGLGGTCNRLVADTGATSIPNILS